MKRPVDGGGDFPEKKAKIDPDNKDGLSYFRNTEARRQSAANANGPPQQTERPTRANSVEEGGTYVIDMETFETLSKEIKAAKPEPKKGTVAWRDGQVYVDKHGNEIFSGYRQRHGSIPGIGWLTGFETWFTSTYDHGCVPTDAKNANELCSNRYQIDHKTPFYTHLRNCCKKREVCDGIRHWDAYIVRFKDEAFTFPVSLKQDKYSNSVIRMCHHNGNLRWMCSTHNPSKSGEGNPDAEFMYDDLGPCPAAEGKGDCAVE